MGFLEPAERSYYKPKVKKLRDNYETLRCEFFELEDKLLLKSSQKN